MENEKALAHMAEAKRLIDAKGRIDIFGVSIAIDKAIAELEKEPEFCELCMRETDELKERWVDIEAPPEPKPVGYPAKVSVLICDHCNTGEKIKL